VCYKGEVLLYGSGIEERRRRTANSRGRSAGKTVLARTQTQPRRREETDQPEGHNVTNGNDDPSGAPSDLSTSRPA